MSVVGPFLKSRRERRRTSLFLIRENRGCGAPMAVLPGKWWACLLSNADKSCRCPGHIHYSILFIAACKLLSLSKKRIVRKRFFPLLYECHSNLKRFKGNSGHRVVRRWKKSPLNDHISCSTRLETAYKLLTLPDQRNELKMSPLSYCASKAKRCMQKVNCAKYISI